MPILSIFVSEFRKWYFLRSTNKHAKNCIKKRDVITFTRFFGHFTAKNKNIALKFGMCVGCWKLYNKYSVFLDNSKILDFIGFWLTRYSPAGRFCPLTLKPPTCSRANRKWPSWRGDDGLGPPGHLGTGMEFYEWRGYDLLGFKLALFLVFWSCRSFAFPDK